MEEGSLVGPDETRSLEQRTARTLDLLCRRRGETVSRSDILDEVWGGRAVSGNSVAVVIGDLRRALDDEPGNPLHIVTIARRGYRLTPEAEEIAPRRRIRFGAWAGGVVLAAGLAVAFIQPEPAWTVTVEAVRNETGLESNDPLARALDEVVTNRLSRFETVSIVDKAAGSSRLVITPKLILWAGMTELSLTAIERSSGKVLWSAMAKGPADQLGASTSAELNGLDKRLESAQGGRLRRILAFLY